MICCLFNIQHWFNVVVDTDGQPRSAIMLFMIVLFMTALFMIALRMIALLATALFMVALFMVVLLVVALFMVVLFMTVLFMAVLFMTVLFMIVLPTRGRSVMFRDVIRRPKKTLSVVATLDHARRCCVAPCKAMRA